MFVGDTASTGGENAREVMKEGIVRELGGIPLDAFNGRNFCVFIASIFLGRDQINSADFFAAGRKAAQRAGTIRRQRVADQNFTMTVVGRATRPSEVP